MTNKKLDRAIDEQSGNGPCECCGKYLNRYSTDPTLTVWMMEEMMKDSGWDRMAANISDILSDSASLPLERAVAEAFLAHLKAKEGR